MNYDVLKPKEKSGAVTLTKPWLKQNLDMKDGDLILQKNINHKGKKIVVLSKFDPSAVNGSYEPENVQAEVQGTVEGQEDGDIVLEQAWWQEGQKDDQAEGQG